MLELASTQPQIDVTRYREALGSFLTGITVITTTDENGQDRGFTANSFTSVSLDPPLVLFCIDQQAGSFDAFTTASGYVVHILGSEQRETAKVFASRSADKFAGMALGRSSTGAPVLESAHAVLDCSVERVVAAGDHAVVIGRVEAFAVEERRPLGFYQGKMQAFNTEKELEAFARQAGVALSVLWVLETLDGRILLRRDGDVLCLPSSLVATDGIHEDALSVAASEAAGARSTIDFLYSMYGSGEERMTLVYRGRIIDQDDEEVNLGPSTCAVPANDAVDLLADENERAVLGRYVEERGDAEFGIYAGSAQFGSVAKIRGLTTAPTS